MAGALKRKRSPARRIASVMNQHNGLDRKVKDQNAGQHPIAAMPTKSTD